MALLQSQLCQTQQDSVTIKHKIELCTAGCDHTSTGFETECVSRARPIQQKQMNEWKYSPLYIWHKRREAVFGAVNME